jgi:GDP-L-fucose synthase
MVGSSIVRQLHIGGLSPASLIFRTYAELDLTKRAGVQAFCAAVQPTQVDLAAASVFLMNLPKAVYDQHTLPTRPSHS